MDSIRNTYQIIQITQFSEADEQEFYKKLWDLLKWQAGRYNSIDSTSIPAEKAQELLDSLVYTLSVVASEDGISEKELLQRDFQTVIKRGQEILAEKRKSVKKQWRKMCFLAPKIENWYFKDTMKNLGRFFKYYRMYYKAHEVPCSIEYPLIKAVSEEVKGISYIEEYINRMMIENQFINSFDFQIVLRLLGGYISNYKDEYVNMCELVLVNAIGRKLLELPILPLDITIRSQNALISLLEEKTQEECYALLEEAAEQVCYEVGISDKQTIEYFGSVIKELSLRLDSALKKKDISHIFISLLPEEIIY